MQNSNSSSKSNKNKKYNLQNSVIKKISLQNPGEFSGETFSNPNRTINTSDGLKQTNSCSKSLETIALVVFISLLISFCLVPLLFRNWKLPEFRISLSDSEGNMEPFLSTVLYCLYFFTN